MNGEIIDALLGLFDQRVAEHLPSELDRIAVDLFERLIDRHSADRHRRVADDPVADVMDVAAGRKIHDRIGAPADRPDHLVDFFRHRRCDGRIADVGVDLHQEVTADDHRLQFRMIDVGGDDGAAARDLCADEFRCDKRGNVGAEAFAIGELCFRFGQHFLAAKILARRDIDHLFGDEAGAGEFILRHWLAGLATQRRDIGRAGRHEPVLADIAIVFRLHGAAVIALEVAIGVPVRAQAWQALREIDLRRVLRIRPRGIVDAHRRLVGRRFEHDFAERHADIRAGFRINLPRTGERAAGDALRNESFRLLTDVHWPLRCIWTGAGANTGRRRTPTALFVLPVPALALPRFRFEGSNLSRRAFGSTPRLAE